MAAALGIATLLLVGCATVESVQSRLGGGSDAERGARGTFLRSDDYRDGEEIVNRFLVDEDYGKMREDVERHGIAFDWAWVDAAEGERPNAPRQLAFSLSDYHTARVAPVVNAALTAAEDIESEVRAPFVRALTSLGLEIVDDGAADLELGLAIVDYKADSTYIYFATLDPFIELEGRLRDTASGRTLFVFRTQEHGATPPAAAVDVASDFAGFLR